MNDIKYTKRHNSYRRIDGVITAWQRQRDGIAHDIAIIDKLLEMHYVQWRTAEDPTVGDQVSVIINDEGVSAKPTRPLLILNHTTGHAHREQNAPEPYNTKKIMLWLLVWIATAMIVSSVIILNTNGVTMLILQLLAAAFIVWRLAIATSDIRLNERSSQRKNDEEMLCSEIISAEWRGATESRKPRVTMADMQAPEPA